MDFDKIELRDYLFNPLTILTVRDKDKLEKIDKLLPYSTGFEIECSIKKSYKDANFEKIPFIMDVGGGEGEIRYRIPNGIKGLICLYFISEQLKLDAILNPGSGIHYHIDCGGAGVLYESLKDLLYRSIHSSVILRDSILTELDTWNYKGTFNTRNIGEGYHYIRFNSDFHTMEFRIGEMTFDYNILIKRIYHANNIVLNVKKVILINPYNSYIPLTIDDFNKIKLFIEWQTNYQVNSINVSKIISQPKVNINNVIQSRVKRI